MKGDDPGLTDGKIEALIRLLADEDRRIRGIAQEKLFGAGARALDMARGITAGAGDPEVREAAERFLREARKKEALDLWDASLAGGDLDLQKGAVLIARSEYPDADLKPYVETLDEYASVLRRRLGAVHSPEGIFEKMNGLLFGELGYRGNHREYYNPENSYLNRVMDRKLGIPISLSLIYILVARRLGQAIEGVGMPGHFLLRYRIGRREAFIDPFHHGRIWTHQDCLAHLRAEGYDFHEAHLRAVGDREILLRMLENLLRIYHSRDDRERVDRITRMQEALRGRGSFGKSTPPGIR